MTPQSIIKETPRLNPANRLLVKCVILPILIILLVSESDIFSQTITSIAAGGNWNSTASWVGGVVPGPANDVIIASGGNNVTVNVAASCANLTIGSGTIRGRLYHNTGIALTVNGTVTMTQGSGTDNRWRIDAGSATVSGLISFTGTSTSTANFATITITTGTLNANGGMLFTASAAGTKQIIMSGGAGTLNLGGPLTIPAASATLTAGTAGSIFNYTGSAAQTINFFSAGAYHNLYINNTSVAGATLSAAISATNVTGNIAVGSVSIGSLFSTGNFNIGLASPRTLTVTANSTMDAGTGIMSFPVTPGSMTINGLFQTANASGFSGGTTTAINSTNNPTINLGTTSTIEFDAPGAQTVTNRVYTGNLVLTGASKTIGTATGQTVTVSGNLTINTGAIYLGSTYNPILNIGGNFINNGTFLQGTSLVNFFGTNVQNISGSSSTTFSNNVTLSNAAGLVIMTSPTINGLLTFASGKITTGANSVILGATATTSGEGAGKYIFGNLEIFIPNATSPFRTFVIGDANNYTPVLVAFSGTTAGSGSLVVYTTAGDHPDIANSGINPALSVNRNWTITQGVIPVGGFTSYSSTFTFINSTPVDLDAGANTASFMVSKITEGVWESTSTGTHTSNSTQANGMTTFGTFQIGESGSLITVAIHPLNTTVCEGNGAAFTSTSGSFPTPSVQWQRDPNTGTFEDILAGTDGGVYTNFSSTTLNILNTTALNNYKYRAKFTNINGTATSNQAVLTVTAFPASAGPITGTGSVCQGQSGVPFSVGAIAGASSYTWNYSGAGFSPSGNTSSVTGSFTSGATSGNLTVTGVNSCGSGTISSFFPITVNPLPVPAGSITGTATVCQGQSGITYSVPSVSGATSYNWLYSGSGFTPSGNTASVTGSFSGSATSGNLTVSGVNSCGTGIYSVNYPITVNAVPAAAGTITGTSSVCQGQSGAAFSIPAIIGATSYTWTYSGTGFTPSGSTASITGSFTPGATSGNLAVTGVNTCGSGIVSANFPITVLTGVPGAAGSITGASTVCQGQTGVAYSVTAISGATSYTWSYSGTGFTPSANTATITGSFAAGATSGNLTVRGVNACGNGAVSAVFPITINQVPLAPGAITGSSAVCQGQSGVAYSIPVISGATSYTWTYSGAGFSPSGTTASITASFSTSATTGNLTVRGVNACGTGSASANYAISVNPLPAAAGTITGTALVCPGQTGVAYSVPAISGATSYTWSYSGTGFTPSGNTASITGAFTAGATSGNLTVRGVNSCGSGISSANYVITINSIPSAAGSITGTSAVCQGQTGVSYSVPSISGATGYTWSYTGSGFTPSGNTASITGSFSAGATSGNLTVRGTNSCGSGTVSASYPITITTGTGAAGTITGTSSICTSGSGVYSVPAISGATSYIWSFTGTGFTASGNTNTITGTFSSTSTSGNLTVRGSGSCGAGAVSISITPPPALN
ncbi:MAG: hypothetical protein NTW16_13625 [Bacteroidetes bacterium]|nr:hypothetical protein [Bacteroidota bacterium]